jgi:hypothetical protein
MSTVYAFVTDAIPPLLLLAAFAVPFRLGLVGDRFLKALLMGWGIFFLSFAARDLLHPAPADTFEPTHLLLTKAGAILGWLPACGFFLLGKLCRAIFRMKGKTVSWSRFTVIIAVLIPLLWWPGSRVYYFVWIDIVGTMAARDTAFAQLSRVIPPADASLVAIYRGLPHQMRAPGRLWHDLFMTSNRVIKRYRFYTEPIAFPAALGDDISKVFKSPGRYQRYLGPKLCGGYHPDLCFEWSSSQGRFYALLCRGCGEVRLVGNGATVHCDLSDEPVRHLDELLKPLKAPLK